MPLAFAPHGGPLGDIQNPAFWGVTRGDRVQLLCLTISINITITTTVTITITITITITVTITITIPSMPLALLDEIVHRLHLPADAEHRDDVPVDVDVRGQIVHARPDTTCL